MAGMIQLNPLGENSIFRGETEEFLDSVCGAVVGHIADVEIAFRIDREAMGPIESAGYEFSLFGKRKSPDLLDHPHRIEAEKELVGGRIAEIAPLFGPTRG